MADPIPSTSMHKPSFFALVLALLVAAPVSVFCQESITVTANGVSFKMIRVQGGTFSMGATSEQGSDAFDDEKPVHQVSLSSYYLCETEVTQELWVAVMGSNPSMFKPKEVSAARGSYDDFVVNANRLNAKRAGTVRIPSRQEWFHETSSGTSELGRLPGVCPPAESTYRKNVPPPYRGRMGVCSARRNSEPGL